MSRLQVACCLTLLGILVGQAVSGDANTGHLEESASEASNSMLASPDGPNVFDFHVGGWPFDVEFPEPSFLPGVTSDQMGHKNEDSSGDVEERQVLDFSPPSRFPLLRDSGNEGLFTRRAEHGVGGWRTKRKPAKSWQAPLLHGSNHLDTTDTWSKSGDLGRHTTWSMGPPDGGSSMEHWDSGPPEVDGGTWVLVHDDYWDRRDRARRNASPSEETASAEDGKRLHRSAHPESWTVWHGGPKDDGAGKFVSSQLGPWADTKIPVPELGGHPPNQAYSEKSPPNGHSREGLKKPPAPRKARNPKQLKGHGKPRRKTKKSRRPPKKAPFSLLNPFAPKKPKVQEKQGNHPIQLSMQSALRNNLDNMMGTIRSGQQSMLQSMKPSRSDLIRLAKLLMVSPAVILLGMDFYRRVATATDPQRGVLFLPRRRKRASQFAEPYPLRRLVHGS